MDPNVASFYMRTFGYIERYQGRTGALLTKRVLAWPLSKGELLVAFPPPSYSFEKLNAVLSFYARTFGYSHAMPGTNRFIDMDPLPLSEEEAQKLFEYLRSLEPKEANDSPDFSDGEPTEKPKNA